ncbi:MAG: haloacid dehalogenase-like hydrolase, partial [Deltaproteobacteria bacterium]|nr:haloacid dehalogenase-like hydrolase [Deltaproteobacteria bacterium]
MTDKTAATRLPWANIPIVNGIPANEVAQSWDLKTSKIQEVFGCTREEAEAVIATLNSPSLKKEAEAGTAFVDFDHVSICRSLESGSGAKCYQKHQQCRPYFPNESCFSITVSKDYSKILPMANWNPYNYQRIRQWLSRLEMTRDESQLILSDYDSTLIVGDTGPVVMKIAVERGYAKFREGEQPYMLEHYKELHPDYQFDPAKENPYTWWKRWTKDNPQFDANALAMGFAGMTVKQIAECIMAAKYDPEYPKAFPELRDLFNHLIDKGKIVGVISASPYLAVALTLKDNGVKVPLWAVEGTDFYVKHPKSGQAVLLSNLVNTELLARNPNATIEDVIKEYGDLVAMRAVHAVQPGQKGKGASGVAIAWRGIDYWNKHKRGHGEMPLTLDQMRLVGYFGDNTAPFSDMLGDNPVSAGNDQGLARVLVPENLLVVNINRGTDKGTGEIDFKEKVRNTENFRGFVAQLRRIYGGAVVLEQDSISKGPAKGIFLPNRLSSLIPFMRDRFEVECRPEDGNYTKINYQGRHEYDFDKLVCKSPRLGVPDFTIGRGLPYGQRRDTDIECFDREEGLYLTERSLSGGLTCYTRNREFDFWLEGVPEGLALKRYHSYPGALGSSFMRWLYKGLERLIALRPENDRYDPYVSD